MSRFVRLVRLAAACSVLIFPFLLRADGGMFWETGVAADLAQTRQEALLAVHPDGGKVTYVIRSMHTGQAGEFAWVLPMPSTPADVVTHAHSDLFAALDADTRPRFLMPTHSGTGGCGCGALGTADNLGELVHVEASGTAGVYNWAALTSTGSGALMDWLNTNGYGVSAAAMPILDGYIAQGMHFLAVRVGGTTAATQGGQSEIPPIQFTVETTRRFYPMTISQVSAAAETEVIVYVVAAHRMEAANLPNGLIDATLLVPDVASESGTNYEQLFRQGIAGLGGLALITEYAAAVASLQLSWSEVPADLAGRGLYLTRLRTVIARDRMTQDFEFQDAASDAQVSNTFTVSGSGGVQAAAGPASIALGTIGLLLGFMRWSHRRPDEWPR